MNKTDLYSMEARMMYISELTPPYKHPRSAPNHGGVYVKKSVLEERARISMMLEKMLKDCAHKTVSDKSIGVIYLFAFAIPKAWPKAKKMKALRGLINPTTKPDSSNLLYFLDNRLEKHYMRNDSQIASHTSLKKYAVRAFSIICAWTQVVDIDEERRIAEERVLDFYHTTKVLEEHPFVGVSCAMMK